MTELAPDHVFICYASEMIPDAHGVFEKLFQTIPRRKGYACMLDRYLGIEKRAAKGQGDEEVLQYLVTHVCSLTC